MEQARLFLATALSILVFFLWTLYFAPKEQPLEQKTAENKKQAPVSQKEDSQNSFVFKEKPEPAVEEKILPEREPRTISIETPLYSATISEKGAVFKTFILKGYKESNEENSDLKKMISQEDIEGTIQLNGINGLENVLFDTGSKEVNFVMEKEKRDISFLWHSPEGIIIEKKYTFVPDTYLISLSVTIKNQTHRIIEEGFTLSLAQPVIEKKTRIGFEGPCSLLNQKLEKIKIKKEKQSFTGNIRWVAIQDRYFITSIIPQKETKTTMDVFVTEDNILNVQYLLPKTQISPEQQESYLFDLYFGPKSIKVLESFNCNLDMAIDIYGPDILARPALWLMNLIYQYIPNYGIAIIILTILIKIVLWPLGTKSYKSMNDMKKLQPLMAEIKEKYKDDKKKMNEEMMGLYKTYKINPVGGCLPMLAQFPVFIAFYGMLLGAIELRHAPFFGWIMDLSAPDRLGSFETLSFLGHLGFHPPYGLPVLTLIMGGTMILQQKMSPPPGDPMQAKMMMFMPVIFTVIFINFASGLVLYWLINNILSIAQQYYISKKFA